jgi:hypothetical protein
MILSKGIRIGRSLLDDLGVDEDNAQVTVKKRDVGMLTEFFCRRTGSILRTFGFHEVLGMSQVAERPVVSGRFAHFR